MKSSALRLLCLVTLGATAMFLPPHAAISYDHSGMYSAAKTAVADGPAYLLPKSFSIHSLDFHKQPSIGNDAGILFIDERGKAKFSLFKTKVPSIAALNKASSKDLLGMPIGPQEEDDANAHFYTFNVLANNAFEQNIYHIDVQFADSDQHWKKYRIRGYQITKPQWQTVE